MEHVNLPTQKAREPDEEAHQPQVEVAITPAMAPPQQKLLEAESSNTNTEPLSQPPSILSHRMRMLWLQQRRSTGLWVQCDECRRWRYLAHVLDKHELPDKWYCRLNPDPAAASCSVPEAPMRIRDEEDLIHSEYSAGSVVWAYMAGWPWWPAMVDDCPDTEQYYWLDGFSDIPTHYHVVFFDATDVTRAWITPEKLKPYAPNKKNFKYLLQSKRYKIRLEAAVTQADDADMLPLGKRLAKYSFVGRYPGAVNEPKTITRKQLKKYQDKLKRKYNDTFFEESSDEAAEDNGVNERNYKEENKRMNIIILGTSSKTKKPLVEEDTFKQPNLLAVLVGSSNPAGGNETETSFDNDTAKTCVPGSESETESEKRIQVRVSSPSSDDFDF